MVTAAIHLRSKEDSKPLQAILQFMHWSNGTTLLVSEWDIRSAVNVLLQHRTPFKLNYQIGDNHA